MEFGFTEQQQSIADLAESLFRDHGSDDHVRALAETGQTLDRPLWRRLAQTGLLALTLPPDGGGTSLGMLELGRVLQQQGRFLAAAPLWTHQLAALAVATHGEPGTQGAGVVLQAGDVEELIAQRRLDDGGGPDEPARHILAAARGVPSASGWRGGCNIACTADARCLFS